MISAGEASPQDYRTGRVSEAMTSLENIQKNWKKFASGGHRGHEHSETSRRKMSESHKALWQDHEFREKMWRARRARQFREKGKCLLRFPRLPVSSTDREWLKGYRKRYHRITGKHLGSSDIRYHEGD